MSRFYLYGFWVPEWFLTAAYLSNFVFFSNYRYFSGLLSAVLSGFLTYVFLEPLFVPVGLDLAMVAMWVLATYSALVGMSLGVLLPTLFPGLCFGVSLALLAGSFLDLSNSLYLPVAGGVCALVGAILSSR